MFFYATKKKKKINTCKFFKILYDLTPPNKTVVARLCVSTRDDDFWHFLTVNVIIAFVLPFILIIVCYALIFKTVVEHRSLAVDARVRFKNLIKNKF